MSPAVRGLAGHFALTLRLNLRSGRALAYGYVVPLLFLLTFAALYRGETPPLQHELGQLITLTVLGGTCFGLPTALVAERERGVWRRYRLLPVATSSLVVMTLLARLVIVGSAVLLQLLLARLLYGTPWPLHPLALVAAYLVVATSFLGLGLLIAALADDVPAVQALGQCLFLPMIVIGGVGVPLAALPAWAQRFSGFMPGRYAVDVLQHAIDAPPAFAGTGFSYVALGVIGTAAGLIGARLFRWDNLVRPPGRQRGIAAVALLVWGAVGLVAVTTGQLSRVTSAHGFAELNDADIATIRFDDLPGDNELVSRLAPPFRDGIPPGRLASIAAALDTWAPAHTRDSVADTRALLSVAAVADVGADVNEAEIARLVFDRLSKQYRHPELRRILAWIALHPDEGSVETTLPGLQLRRGRPDETVVRERVALYARKLLGRLNGQISAP